jgi:mycothiol synthase
MEVVELAGMSEPGRAELAQLLARAGMAQGHPALPEPELHAVSSGGTGTAVLSHVGGRLVGAVFLFAARDDSTVLHVVVDPEAAGDGAGLAFALAERAVTEADATRPVHLWAMRAGAGADDLARSLGFTPERDLLQMRVPLPLDPKVVEASKPLPTRPFVPGRDEQAWVESNNRAFEGHPEQGGWTVEQLRERLAAGWIDLDGFLVADAPDGAGFIGSCWTKIHRDHEPVLGEIYVISVDPRFHRLGWGRSLTVEGLEWLARQGVPVGMLYTDASNETAVALYRKLGFSIDHVDRSYRRPPAD